MSDAAPDPETEAETPATPSGAQKYLALARRASWNIIDQALSALTNAVLFFLAARIVDKAGLDAFATAFLLFSLAIGVERALVGQVFGIRLSDATGDRWRSGLAQGLGTVLSVTASIGVVLIAVGLLVHGPLRTALVVTGVLLPGLVMQDACRMAFFAQGRAQLSALNDALWAVVQFSAMGVLVATDHANLASLTLAWGGAAAVCVGVALAQLKVLPRPAAAGTWLRENRELSGFMLAEYLLTAGAFNGGFIIVGFIAGEGAVSSLRGAQVLLGPLSMFASALMTFALPELSRRPWLSSSARWKVAGTTATVMTLASLAYTAAIVLMPDAWGVFLFDDKWAMAQAVFLPVALASTAGGTALGPAIVIYAMGLARKTFRIMTVEAPLVFVLMIGGAWWGGAVPAAWGLAADQIVVIPLWFLQLRAILRGRAGEPTSDPAGATPSAGSPRAAVDR